MQILRKQTNPMKYEHKSKTKITCHSGIARILLKLKRISWSVTFTYIGKYAP